MTDFSELSQYEAETGGSSEECLRHSVRSVFEGHMFLFGFKTGPIPRSSQSESTLQLAARHFQQTSFYSQLSQINRGCERLPSLVAYQLLQPEAGMEAETVLAYVQAHKNNEASVNDNKPMCSMPKSSQSTPSGQHKNYSKTWQSVETSGYSWSNSIEQPTPLLSCERHASFHGWQGSSCRTVGRGQLTPLLSCENYKPPKSNNIRSKQRQTSSSSSTSTIYKSTSEGTPYLTCESGDSDVSRLVPHSSLMHNTLAASYISTSQQGSASHCKHNNSSIELRRGDSQPSVSDYIGFPGLDFDMTVDPNNFGGDISVSSICSKGQISVGSVDVNFIHGHGLEKIAEEPDVDGVADIDNSVKKHKCDKRKAAGPDMSTDKFVKNCEAEGKSEAGDCEKEVPDCTREWEGNNESDNDSDISDLLLQHFKKVVSKDTQYITQSNIQTKLQSYNKKGVIHCDIKHDSTSDSKMSERLLVLDLPAGNNQNVRNDQNSTAHEEHVVKPNVILNESIEESLDMTENESYMLLVEAAAHQVSLSVRITSENCSDSEAEHDCQTNANKMPESEDLDAFLEGITENKSAVPKKSVNAFFEADIKNAKVEENKHSLERSHEQTDEIDMPFSEDLDAFLNEMNESEFQTGTMQEDMQDTVQVQMFTVIETEVNVQNDKMPSTSNMCVQEEKHASPFAITIQNGEVPTKSNAPDGKETKESPLTNVNSNSGIVVQPTGNSTEPEVVAVCQESNSRSSEMNSSETDIIQSSDTCDNSIASYCDGSADLFSDSFGDESTSSSMSDSLHQNAGISSTNSVTSPGENVNSTDLWDDMSMGSDSVFQDICTHPIKNHKKKEPTSNDGQSAHNDSSQQRNVFARNTETPKSRSSVESAIHNSNLPTHQDQTRVSSSFIKERHIRKLRSIATKSEDLPRLELNIHGKVNLAKRKSVQFSYNLRECQTLDHIDKQMKSTPTPLIRKRSLRAPCIKMVLVSPVETETPGGEVLQACSQEMFTPSPEVITNSSERLLSNFSLRRGLTYQSTPLIKETDDKDHIPSSPPDVSAELFFDTPESMSNQKSLSTFTVNEDNKENSGDMFNSMDLFSCSSINQDIFRNTGSLFSDESADILRSDIVPASDHRKPSQRRRILGPLHSNILEKLNNTKRKCDLNENSVTNQSKCIAAGSENLFSDASWEENV